MYTGSLIRPRDNSGVKIAKIIRIYKRKYKWQIGDLLIISARRIKLRKNRNAGKGSRRKKIMKLKKGQLVKALLVFTSRQFLRTGMLLRGNQNSIIIIKKNFFYELIGTRVRTPVFMEVRKFKLAKLMALAYSIV